MKFLVFAIVLAFLYSACVVQSCDITGKWEYSGSISTDYVSQDGSEEYEFNSDLSYTKELTASTESGYGSCGFTTTEEGTYTYDADDCVVLTPSSCEYSDCSGDCEEFCSIDCTDPHVESFTVVWASDCSSWHTPGLPEVVFEPAGPNWLLWVLLAAVVIGAIAVTVVAVVVGVVLWKKKQASSNAYIYEQS